MIHGGVAGERGTVTLMAAEERTIFIRSIFVNNVVNLLQLFNFRKYYIGDF